MIVELTIQKRICMPKDTASRIERLLCDDNFNDFRSDPGFDRLLRR